MSAERRNRDYDIRAADVPADLFPGGRVRFSLGVSKVSEANRRRERLNDLRRWHAWDVLKAIEDGTLHVASVCRQVAQNGEGAVAELRRRIEAEKRGEAPTVRAEADRYLKWYGRPGRRSPNSVKQVRSRLKRLCEQPVDVDGEEAPLGEIRIDRLRKRHGEHAIERISTNPSTREAMRLALSGLYTWSVGEELEEARTDDRAPRWEVNPAKKIERHERAVRPETASREQAVRLLAAGEPYQAAYVRAYLHLGLRLDELIHTRLHLDLDTETWTWEIQPRDADPRCSCAQCAEGGWSPKGWPRSKRSRRTLLVPDEPAVLRASIERYLELYPCEEGDYLFRNPRTDRVWYAGRLQVDFKRLCERAEVKYGRDVPGGITIHTLRHTCATNLVRAGVRESVIAGLLGDTVETIVRVYVNLEPEDLADGVRRGPSYDPDSE